MARLPDYQELGGLPEAAGPRAIGKPDASAIGLGIAKLGQGVEQAGQGLGELESAKGRWQYAMATSDFLTQQEQIKISHQDDPDYKTLPQRYTDEVTKAQGDVAQQIENPTIRERFIQSTNRHVALGQAQVGQHAFNLESNDLEAQTVDKANRNVTTAAGLSFGDPRRTALIQANNDAIDGLVGQGRLTPMKGLELKQHFAAAYGEASILQDAKTDPVGALNTLRAAPGSDDQIVSRIVQVESGGNPTASAKTSSAFGAAQFLASRQGGDQTWKELLTEAHPDLVKGKSLDEINALRADPNLSREMLGRLLEKNRSYLQGKGIEATPGALYLSHFAGPAAAAAILQANPNTPVSDVLAKAVGPDMAAKMIAANPTILSGRLSGSVAQWADAKMGGIHPGEGSIYDYIPAQRRALLESHLETQAHGKKTDDLATFHNAVQNDVAEADRTGSTSAPKTVEDFVANYGPERGPMMFNDYRDALQAGADKSRMADMSEADMNKLIGESAPKPGSTDYARQGKRQDAMMKVRNELLKQRNDDPAAFAISRLPTIGDSYGNLIKTLNDPKADDTAKQGAARDFAAKMQMEQTRLGIAPEDQRLFPQPYIDKLSNDLSAAARSEDPKARQNIVARIQQEAQLWGNKWPQAYRQMAPKVEPLVRVIASGIDQPAAITLANLADKDTKKLLAEQDEVKAKDVHDRTVEAFRPFAQSVAGSEATGTIKDFLDQGEKLAAYYVTRGSSAEDAADLAYKQMIGNHYSFQDGYRVPKSVPFPPGDIAAGAAEAKDNLDKLGIAPERDDRGGLSADYLAKHTADSFRRDGKWITAPDESGLALVYDGMAVRKKDGSALIVSWKDLSEMGLARGKAKVSQNLELGLGTSTP